MKMSPQKIVSLVILLVLIYGNLTFKGDLFVRDDSDENMRRLEELAAYTIDENYYDLSTWVKNSNGTYEPAYNGDKIIQQIPIMGDTANDAAIFNPDLDEDGKLTVQELYTYQTVSTIRLTLEDRLLASLHLLDIYAMSLLVMIDTIGLAVIISPWLKKEGK